VVDSIISIFLKIHEHIIYNIGPISIRQKSPPLLSDLKIPEEEESVTLSDVLMLVPGGAIVVRAVVRIIEEEEKAVAILVVAARPRPRGRERRLIHFLLMHRKYTVRFTRMQSNNMLVPLKDERVSSKAKNRSLTRSRGLL
jgi:hypothetical protein